MREISSNEVEKLKELPCRLLFRSTVGCIENLFGRTIFLEFPESVAATVNIPERSVPA